MKEGFATEFTIEDEWLPYEIHPETPPEGVLLKEYFPGLNIEAFQQQMDQRGKPMGARFNPQPLMSNSRRSMMGGEFAKEYDKPHEYHEAMFKAYFTDSRDIGDMAVLREIAASVGLNADDFEAAIEAETYLPILTETTTKARSNFVTAAPTFIIEGHGAISGAQPTDTFRKAFAQAAEKNQ